MTAASLFAVSDFPTEILNEIGVLYTAFDLRNITILKIRFFINNVVNNVESEYT